jgi:hypothetical protein
VRRELERAPHRDERALRIAELAGAEVPELAPERDLADRIRLGVRLELVEARRRLVVAGVAIDLARRVDRGDEARVELEGLAIVRDGLVRRVSPTSSNMP